MEGEYELICGLSNGAISNDLERTLTHRFVNKLEKLSAFCKYPTPS